MKAFWCVAVLAAILAGCGGGSDGPPEPPSCVPKVVRIQLFGDSTMVGIAAELGFTQAPNNPGHVLQVEMDRRFGAGAVVVTNHAVSGSNSAQLMAVWPGGANGDILVVNHGINDAQIPTGIEPYKANLRTIARTAPIVFMTPNPGYGRPINPDAYAQAMREVAAELGRPVADAHAYVLGLPGWRDWINDGIHPSAAGYELIARNVLVGAVVPLVAKLRCQ